MNISRAERRRELKASTKKKAIYTLNEEQIEAIKQDATKKAMRYAFKLLLCIPVCVLHDKIDLLWKKEIDGKNRETRMAEYIMTFFRSVEMGNISLRELEQILEDETGMKFGEMENL